ncbi:MAG TPA: EAL domain-containing protein [Acetobacteraceae bacterium]
MQQQDITIHHPDAPYSLPSLERRQLDAFAWLAVTTHGAEAAMIVVEQDGGLAPAGSSGLDAEGVLPLIELCRRLRTGPETTVACEVAAPHGTGLPPRLFAAAGLVSATGEVMGRLCVLYRSAQGDLPPDDRRSLGLLAGLIADHLVQQRRDAEQQAASQRATRTERMLHLVAEAASVTDALTDVLSELCSHHGAVIGRIWRLTSPGDQMQEVSRFNADDLDADSYYRRPPAAPVRWGNSMTADAIRRNQPRGFSYAEVVNPERYVLMQAAVQAGLRCQISYPIWVQEERFGVSLAFKTDRRDLPDVITDIGALANAIRPALFRKVTEDRMRFLAHHDDLTGLANRLLLQDRMKKAFAVTAGGGPGLALLHFDLNNFKQVNDASGHAVGDRLLAAVARRLSSSLREGDTIARMGSDEFAIIQPHTGHPAAAASLAGRVVETLAAPFEIDGQRIKIGCCIGVALHPGDGDTPDLLLRNADTALYRAKETGRNRYALFEPGMDTGLRERVLIEGEMADALARRQFTLAYQPLCDAATLRIVGFEALLRWTHPTRGPIEPEFFIQLAESSGLIVPLGQWALEAACAEAAGWDPSVRLGVNLSPMQFRQPDLPRQVADILAHSGMAPHRLDLEVTEGMLLDETGLVLDTMGALRAQGIGMTLDDFGTAYASLSYLRRFPFNRIKVDKSFVADITTDKETLAIVQAILALSIRLNLSVVAEGVETSEQLDVLRGLGCRVVQGFLTGRPISGDEVAGRLAEQAA